jgi:hypothetical protein
MNPSIARSSRTRDVGSWTLFALHIAEYDTSPFATVELDTLSHQGLSDL